MKDTATKSAIFANLQTVMGKFKRHSASIQADHLKVTDKKVETRKAL